MIKTHHLAIDLGASSGRVALVSVSSERVSLGPVKRFANGPVQADGWRWDLRSVMGQVIGGMVEACARTTRPQSAGVDTWGVDYGWIDHAGEILDDPYCYRDPRAAEFVSRIDADRAYSATGVPTQAINTSAQLMSDITVGRGGVPFQILFMPDLINFALTGQARTEASIASTSQLADVSGTGWAPPMITMVGVRPECLPEIGRTGRISPVRDVIAKRLGARLSVESIASHDTASALVAAPILESGSAYLSLGTWACIGVERLSPLITPQAQHRGFTNEHGLDGRITFHRSTMGLWLLQQCLDEWGEPDVAVLLDEASRTRQTALIDPNDPLLFQPGGMSARINTLCAGSGQAPPQTSAGIARCIVDSLAAAYAEDLTSLETVTGDHIRRLHIVGGGSRSPFICQAIADASDRLVIAGPAEATALGNALTQARSYGGPSTVPEIRELVARSVELIEYRPGGQSAAVTLTPRFRS